MGKKKKRGTKSFAKGIIILMIAQVFVKILGLVYKLYLTNREGFGDKGNAIYSSGFQIYALLLTLSSMGVPNAISKLVSERVAVGDHKGAHRIFKISFVTFGFIGFLCSAILFCGAGYIANRILQIPEAELTLVALSPSIFFVALSAVIKGYFNGREDVEVTAKSQTLEQVFKTISSVVLVEIIAIISGTGTVVMAAGANLATTLATGLCFSYLYRYYKYEKKEIAFEIKNSINYRPTRIRKTIKQILSVSIPMSLTSILGSINKNVDSMTVVRGLKKFMSEESAKIQYGILTGKVDTLVMLPLSFNMAFSTSLIPAVSSMKAKGNMEGGIRKVKFSMLISILIGLPCSVGMIILAKPILELLFPNATSGAFIYQISSIGIIFIILEQTISGALHGLGKITIPALCLSVGVVIKLFLNITLIPLGKEGFIFGGVAGAALATTICHIVSATLELMFLKKYMNIKFDKSKFLFKPIIAVIGMGILSYFIYLQLLCIINAKLCTIIAMLLACMIYILLVIMLKIFSKEEIILLPKGDKIYKILTILHLY